MARRAQDDMIAALKDCVSLEAEHPKSQANAVRLLFTAREVAPVDAAILRGIRAAEHTIAGKPGLKAALMEPGRPVEGFLQPHRKGSRTNSSEPEITDSDP